MEQDQIPWWQQGRGAETFGTAAAQEPFSVVLNDTGKRKVEVIQIIRQATGLGLLEAKEITERTPRPVQQGLSRPLADDLGARLAAAGASVNLQPAFGPAIPLPAMAITANRPIGALHEHVPWYRQDNKVKKAAGFGAVAAATAAKAGGGLKLLVVLGKGALLTKGYGLLSILATVWWHARYLGWLYGNGFVVLIFIHEMGHNFAARRRGYAADLPAFRFFYVYVRHNRPASATVYDDALVSFAGPVWGGIGAQLCLVAYFATGDMLWRALAYVGFFLNLINLLPFRPFDGGGIVRALHRPRAAERDLAYFQVPAVLRWGVGLGFLLLVGVLFGLMQFAAHSGTVPPGSFSPFGA